jgi:predicted ATPase/DNA-binding SARP family transcriptional activator
MQFRILGPLEVLDDEGRPLALGGAKQRALLATLLLHGNEVVSVDRLIDELWGENPPDTASHILQVYVANLRKMLEPARARRAAGGILRRQPPGYLVEVGPDELDLRAFLRLAVEGRAALAAGDPSSAAHLLRSALELWRGPALADVVLEVSGQGEVTRLEERRLAVLEECLDAELNCGRHAEVVGELQALVAADPLRERLRGQLMVALYRCGRQAEALDVYRSTRKTLAEELGIDPGPVLQELERAILAQASELAPPPPSRYPTRASVVPDHTQAGEARHNLPAATSRLIGRAVELAGLRQVLRRDDVRLLTLTGPGGIGKTRLALAAAESAREGYPGGTFVVWLAGIGDSADVMTAVARALEVTGNPTEPLAVTVARTLAGRETLLLLDNFEHVLSAAPLLAELLAAAPGLRLLVTSRARLRLSGEHEYPVPPLRLPRPALAGDLAAVADCEAVALFVERAVAVRPGFTLSGSNVGPVAEICLRLDGLPLAIELAAARSRVLAPQELLKRLERRLAILTGGPRDLPARQQTLRATIDWTYQLLGPAERQLFEQFALFIGGATLAATEAICSVGDAEPLDVLEQLLDKSLLQRDDTSGQPRYLLLETVREYALERFDQRADVQPMRQRHAEFFLDVAEAGEAGLRTAEHPAWLRRFDADHGNLRAAFETLLAGPDPAPAQRLAAALWRWWESRDPNEGRRWLAAALDGRGQPGAIRAKALYALARITLLQGEHGEAIALLRESLALSERHGSLELAVLARGLLGWGLAEIGNQSEAQATLAGYLAAVHSLLDPWARAEALNYLGAALISWDVEGSVERFQESLALRRRLGDQQSIGHSLNNIGCTLLGTGQYRQAGDHLAESLEIGRQLRDELMITLALNNLGQLALFEHRYDDSVRTLTENTRLCAQRGDRRILTETLPVLAAAHAGCARPEHAARLTGASEGINPLLTLVPFVQAEVGRHLAKARQELGDAGFAALAAEGRRMSLDAVAGYTQAVAADSAPDTPVGHGQPQTPDQEGRAVSGNHRPGGGAKGADPDRGVGSC